MPNLPEIIGLTNIWYEEAFNNSTNLNLDNDTSIRVISVPYFIATKIEAFNGRGNNDYLGSPDIEDVVTVIDGREELLREVESSSPELKEYLSRN